MNFFSDNIVIDLSTNKNLYFVSIAIHPVRPVAQSSYNTSVI
ncbi:hypothetical protein XNC1_2106 [Xenorhabdus nematophila ATCC 19061]|uniref:Uncharacterized protein n=1 Tax=Xenorhabdus nematophila (strain ATCC 19061 / DSM 3370 / CCUG 14189 / LMG 1036 / NCIMB 9965 / AN6) TaxID=406817 RepID=D3VEQ4_XENNA|nr:hypothetical protein XNC1_2106 [Xenorhabdus nematophila ATCC 19061]